MLLTEIQESINGTTIQFVKNQEITHILIDSRKLIISQGSLFFAICGKNHDGHRFIVDAYLKGIRSFIVDNPNILHNFSLPEANIICVKNTTKSLQDLAKHHRKKHYLKILAITGSNAKTTIKEYLSQMLDNDFNLVKSPKSYNSQVGVPLSLWQINEIHNFGIFEAGISTTNEMSNLQSMIDPEIGIFTNIGSAHDEGFENLDEKVNEKLKLFKSTKCLIYRKDHKIINFHVQQNNIPCLTWSTIDTSADIFVTKKENGANLNYKGKSYSLNFPFNDLASFENLTHCVTLLLLLGFEESKINQCLKKITTVSMRLELKQGRNNCYIIDDSYNNDLAGLQVALEFAQQQQLKKNKTVIISDLVQAHKNSNEVYESVSQLLSNYQITKIIAIGPNILKHQNVFPRHTIFLNNTEEFLEKYSAPNFNNELILVKGARKMFFEKIVEKLQQKNHGTVLEINLEALIHNLNYYKSKVSRDCKIMAMVKAFAYGSGSYEVAHLMQFHNVDYLGVAYTDEAIELRQNGISLPIMVLNVSKENFSSLIHFNLEPEIYSFQILNDLIQFVTENHINEIGVHLDIDTGMRRLGFETEDLNDLVELLKSYPQIKIKSIYSHLAGADDTAHNAFTLNQIEKFVLFSESFEKTFGHKPLRHICNSAGIVSFPQAHFDMVRLGVGLYGVEASNKEQNKLKVVSTLKTVIAQIKQIKPGDTVGYGRWGVAESEMTIATINIGYADGYSRAFSRGVGKILVNGNLVPTIGNVCMDMCMIDITGVKASEGDEVVIFGDRPTIHDLAESINTIPYEILTNVSDRVKRIFYA